jgi:hypothetical protein
LGLARRHYFGAFDFGSVFKMSALSLILGEKQFRTAIGVLRLDAAASIQHNATATPTKNPIEARSGDPIDNFTDHVRLENRTLSIDGLISESPLTVIASALSVFTGASSSLVRDAFGGGALGGFAQQALAAGVGSIAGLIENRNDDDIQYPSKAFQYLEELRDNRVPFTVITSLKRYENMILTNLSVPQTGVDGKSLRFSATFEQIQIVQTQVVIIPEQTVTNPSAASKQNLGKQAQNAATEDNGSVAKGFFDSIGITTRGSGL